MATMACIFCSGPGIWVSIHVYAAASFTDHTIAGLHQGFNLSEMIPPANALVGGRLAKVRIAAAAEAATRDIVRHHVESVERSKAAERFQAVQRIQAAEEEHRQEYNRRRAAAASPALFAIFHFLQGALRAPRETARQARQFVSGNITANVATWAMWLVLFILLLGSIADAMLAGSKSR
jgi:hypothetical protein